MTHHFGVSIGSVGLARHTHQDVASLRINVADISLGMLAYDAQCPEYLTGHAAHGYVYTQAY
jgi:hypothetical protein